MSENRVKTPCYHSPTTPCIAEKKYMKVYSFARKRKKCRGCYTAALFSCRYLILSAIFLTADLA